MNINLGNNTVTVKVIYKNNRNLYFRFDENAVLIVTCPKFTRDDEIVRLIKKNETALLKMYTTAVEKQKYQNEFWYLGEKYNVVYQEGIKDPEFEGNFVYIENDTLLDIFIKDEINRVFNEEINICKKCFKNLPEFKLKTRTMKTRWGVCNRGNNTITLNTELIKHTLEEIDYVIIHEMAHFYEGNHGKHFWAIVEAACPNYKTLRGMLKK